MEKQTKIVIGAEVSQAEAALKKLNGALGQIEQSAGNLKNPFQALGPYLLSPVAAATVGFTALGAAIKRTADAGEEMGKFAQQAGVSVEWISGMKYAAEQSETSVESLVTGLGLLSKGMAEGGEEGNKVTDALNALGINAKNADGTLRPTETLFAEIAEKFSGMEDGAGKTALAMQLFGRSGKELIPLLNEGAAGIERMRAEAARLGIVFSEDMAKAADQFNDNLDKMTFRLSGLAKTITGPVLAAFNSFWAAIEKPGPETEAALIRLEKLFEAMKQSALPGWSSPFGALKAFENNPKIAALMKAQEENDKRRAGYAQMSPQDRLIEDVLSDTQHRRIKTSAPSTGSTESTNEPKGKSLADLAEEHRLAMMKQEEKEAEERRKRAEAEQSSRRDTWQRTTDALKQLEQGLTTFGMDEIGRRLNAVDEWESHMHDLLLKAGLAHEEYEEYMTEITRKATAERAKIADDAYDEAIRNTRHRSPQQDDTSGMSVKDGMLAGWQQVADPLENSFEQGVAMARNAAGRMEQGFSDLFFNVMEGKANSLYDIFHGVLVGVERAAADTLAHMLVQYIAQWVAMEQAKTAATTVGVTTRTAIEEAGAAQGLAISAFAALKTIGNSAWEAAAGAYKAIAGIPYVGPFLAPVMAVAAGAAVMKFAGNLAFAEKGFDVDRDQLAYIHKKEMVLPAPLAERVRNMTGGGGQSVTVNISYGDINGLTDSNIRRILKDHASSVADAVKMQVRNFQPAR